MIINELTEHALQERKNELAAENKDYTAELIPLSKEVDEILSKLPESDADIINRYISKSSAVADKDCAFLYVQGAKDCVRLLKTLGVF
jgi:hypothetical protein